MRKSARLSSRIPELDQFAFKSCETAPKRLKHVKIKTEAEETPKSLARIHYKDAIDRIIQMRSNRDAIVDQFGTEQLGQGEDKVFRFQTLVSVMLSSMTKDQDTAAATKRLQSMEGGLTIPSVQSKSETDLSEIIRGVGFHNRKAVYLKKIAAILHEQYNDDIPNTLEEMVRLPGIGSKMAKIALSAGWGQVVGIAADTHVHRICNRLGWTFSKNPLQTEKQLESWLPREYWKDMNLLLVGLGQQICSAKKPQCSTCTLNDICPKIGVKANKMFSAKNNLDWVYSNLYVGDQYAAGALDRLIVDYNISFVLNVAWDLDLDYAPQFYIGDVEDNNERLVLQYSKVGLVDGTGNTGSSLMAAVFMLDQFVTYRELESKDKGTFPQSGNILVHCHSGKSRSVTVSSLFLSKKYSSLFKSFDHALQYVKERRGLQDDDSVPEHHLLGLARQVYDQPFELDKF